MFARALFFYFALSRQSNPRITKKEKIYIYIYIYYNTLKCLTRTHMLARISGADSTWE